MKNILLTLIIALTATISAKADEQDTLWFRWTDSEIQRIDFTPDDKYVIAWTNAIEFWDVEKGFKEDFIITESTGDYNYSRDYLVFSQDSTPKLLNWRTREVIEGFEKEKENIGLIRTAKSKNEFMANTFHINTKSSAIIGNAIYFYNIESKRKVDSLSFIKQFEKDGFKWKRTIHDYDYVGTNDEFIYVVIDDVNDEIDNIPSQLRKRNYFVHFYNIETKELVDSIYSFTNTNKQFGGFDKMYVMNNRNSIAWNRKGGEISIYNINTKTFDKKIEYSQTKSEINDLDYIDNGNIIAIADGAEFRIINLESNELLQYYNFGINHVKFSNNLDVFTLGGNTSISIRNKKWLNTSIKTYKGLLDFEINPNPVSYTIRINFQTKTNINYKLSLIDLIGSELEVIEEGDLNTLSYQKDYNVSTLPSGIYFIRLEFGDEIIVKQFIKE